MKYKSYEELKKWHEIMKLLPKHNQIDPNNKPKEVMWNWKDNSIHIDYYKNPEAKIKLITLHGVGGNGRLLSFIAVPLYKHGIEVISPDLPGFGITDIPRKRISYAMWIDLINDLINYELEKDDRPIILFGFSAGGMLAYQVACKNRKVAGLIFTNLLDQRIPQVIKQSAIHPLVATLGKKIMKVFSYIWPTFKLPMKFVANTGKLVNDKEILKLLLSDKHSAGSSVPIELIATLTEAKPEIEPEDFNLCPVLLVHPEKDAWTPIEVSRLFFDKIKCEREITMLKNAGHFPIEQPGLTQLEESSIAFINKIIMRNS